MQWKIYKFGGASVKDADAVKNVAHVLAKTGCENCLMVVSAMGKTTNALEEVVKRYRAEEAYWENIEKIEQFHSEIAHKLLPETHEIHSEISELFSDLLSLLKRNKSTNYSYVYDQVVSHGEMASTKIVSAFLNHSGMNNEWLDVRDFIKTNSDFRSGKVNWEETEKNIQKLECGKFYITQGFLGADENYATTTLGREGSDYTGAIFAYALKASGLTIWKDVSGVLNADPRYFKSAKLLQQISYKEAIELAYFGASVIHPKTLQPLQRKKIPLYVKSFINPEGEGTVIKEGQSISPELPCYIVKKNQNVITISTKSFSFIDESVIRDVYHRLAEFKLKVNLIQISAISLYLCVEDKYDNIEKAMNNFESDFFVKIVKNCSLYTIRHYQENAILEIPKHEDPILKQSGKITMQVVVKD